MLFLKQILVLDEADRILDHGFRAEVDAILGELPRVRQTLLFSATQTKSVKDLARVSLSNPEYISVHAEAVTATPERLKQLAMVVPMDQKLDMLWSFIRKHLNCKILVFLTTCKQVRNFMLLFYFLLEFDKYYERTPLKEWMYCIHTKKKFLWYGVIYNPCFLYLFKWGLKYIFFPHFIYTSTVSICLKFASPFSLKKA